MSQVKYKREWRKRTHTERLRVEREYREKNKRRLNEYSRQYQAKVRKERPDYNAAIQAKYWKVHRKEMTEKQRERRRNNRIEYNIQQNLRILRRKEKIAGRKKPESCEICGANDRVIVFDHNHEIGKFRGWICHNCNAVIGMAKEDPDVLQRIIEYLNRNREK